MQEEVDPEVGQSEIVAMRKEIHRMELMFDQLRKKQEEMIKNMERAVFKKETIQLKYQPKVEKKNAEDKCKYFFYCLICLLYYSFQGKTFSLNRQPQADPAPHHRQHHATRYYYRAAQA
jgi:hypothetical protein